MIRQWLFNQPARVIDYSTMIEPQWVFVIINQLIKLDIHSSSQSISINLLAWVIIRQWLFNRVVSTSWRNCLLDNDWVTLIMCQLACLIIRHWLSHIDYLWLINKLMKLMIHSGSQASSINQLAWLIICVIDYSATIRQWLFSQPARVMDYSTMIESHWIFIRVVKRVQSTNSHDRLFVLLIIEQRFEMIV